MPPTSSIGSSGHLLRDLLHSVLHDTSHSFEGFRNWFCDVRHSTTHDARKVICPPSQVAQKISYSKSHSIAQWSLQRNCPKRRALQLEMGFDFWRISLIAEAMLTLCALVRFVCHALVFPFARSRDGCWRVRRWSVELRKRFWSEICGLHTHAHFADIPSKTFSDLRLVHIGLVHA